MNEIMKKNMQNFFLASVIVLSCTCMSQEDDGGFQDLAGAPSATPMAAPPAAESGEWQTPEKEESGLTTDVAHTNWAEKLKIQKQAGDLNTQVRAEKKTVMAASEELLKKYGAFEQKHDEFLLNTGMLAGAAQEQFDGLTRQLQDLRARGKQLTEEQRKLLGEIENQKNTVEKIHRGFQRLSEMDAAFDKAMKTAMEQVAKCDEYENTAVENFEKIPEEFSDQVARQHYQNIAASLENIRAVSRYLSGEMNTFFDHTAAALNKQMDDIKKNVEEARALGVDLFKKVSDSASKIVSPLSQVQQPEELTVWGHIVATLRAIYDACVNAVLYVFDAIKSLFVAKPEPVARTLKKLIEEPEKLSVEAPVVEPVAPVSGPESEPKSAEEPAAPEKPAEMPASEPASEPAPVVIPEKPVEAKEPETGSLMVMPTPPAPVEKSAAPAPEAPQPAEASPAPSTPEEKPAEEKPAEEKPTEPAQEPEKPAEEKPAEEKPAEEKPAEESAEQKAEAEKAKKLAEEKKIAEAKPAEKPEEGQLDIGKPAEAPAEKQAEEEAEKPAG